MKRKNIIIKFLFLSLVFVASSCSESFLDTQPRGVLTSDNFYKTDDEAFQALLGAFDILQNANSSPFVSDWALKTFPGDEVTAGGGGRADQPQLEELNEFNYGSSNTVVTFVFNRLFQGVNRANSILAYVGEDTDAKKVVRAEAKFLRALFYFDLVTLYGKVPLVTKELSPSEYQQLPSKEEEIWALIEKDLNEAIAVLPLRSASQYKFMGHKGAAQALLGKAYLYQKKYDEAATQLQSVITSGEYSLIADYSRILRKDQEFGKESLFEVSYSTSEGNDWGNYSWGNSRYQENNIIWQFCGPRGDYFNVSALGMFGGWGGAYPTSQIYKSYIDNGDVVRRTTALISESEFKEKGASKNSETIYGYVGYLRLKYTTYLDETATPVNELNMGTNLRLIRYADVLLMAAEANILKASKDYAKAKGFVDLVRSRAGLPACTESGADLMQRVITERKLELSFEGHRFQDLIRWNKAGVISDAQLSGILDLPRAELSYRKAFEAKFKLFPIPEQEILTNPNMVQNTGY